MLCQTTVFLLSEWSVLHLLAGCETNDDEDVAWSVAYLRQTFINRRLVWLLHRMASVVAVNYYKS